MDEMTAKIKQALTDLGLTEIEFIIKPKNKPGPHLEFFISCETRPETSTGE